MNFQFTDSLDWAQNIMFVSYIKKLTEITKFIKRNGSRIRRLRYIEEILMYSTKKSI